MDKPITQLIAAKRGMPYQEFLGRMVALRCAPNTAKKVWTGDYINGGTGSNKDLYLSVLIAASRVLNCHLDDLAAEGQESLLALAEIREENAIRGD
jgi:hypothetical protein